MMPYRFPELFAAPDQPIFIVEGEKDIDRIRELGLVATCNAGGAGRCRKEFAEFFKDRSRVVLPDNDDAGREHARQVVANFAPLASDVRVVELPDLPLKGDVSDWLIIGGTRDELERLAREAEPASPESGQVEAARERKSRKTSNNGPGRNLPTIQVDGGRLPANVDMAELLLLECDRDICRRGDVYTARGW